MAATGSAAGARTESWLRRVACGLRLEMLARPGASRRGIVGIDSRGLVVALQAPPDRGRANDELIEYLARALKLPRANVTIAQGLSSRRKTLKIATAEPERIAETLERLAYPERRPRCGGPR